MCQNELDLFGVTKTGRLTWAAQRTSLMKSLIFAVLLALCVVREAWAVVIPPSDNYQSLVYTFDRAAPQAILYLYNDVTGFLNTDNLPQTEDNSPYRLGHWTCRSSANPLEGACTSIYPDTPITLRFTEKRSRLYIDLTLLGRKRAWYGESGASNACYLAQGITSSTSAGGCLQPDSSRIFGSGWALSVWFPQGELNKLPTGGIWTAKLILNQRVFRTTFAQWTTDLEIRVTDKNNIEAYLPAFGNAAALVDLNLRTQPLTTAGGQVSGLANLDMCLYDGYNSNSTSYLVRVSDKLNIAGRASDAFSVISQNGGGATDAFNRVDYTVTMMYNGHAMTLRNGEEFTLSGVDSSQIRAVRIPNVTWPVVCSPTPLTLRTASFNQLQKRAGRYQGVLNIVFTPSSEAL